MKRTVAVCVLTLGVAACGDGNPFTDAQEGAGDTAAGSAFLDQNDNLVVNNISFDATNDVLTINNIPFDDPDNRYERITTETFVNGFDAYQSAPAPGSAELQYFAIFRRSDSGRSQVAASTSAEYIGFGFGGGGAQRLSSSNPNLPRNGLYTYNGEYGGVRTILNSVGNGDSVQYVTGDVQLAADFGDFDDVGAVNGGVSNRILYDDTGTQIGTLNGFLSLANGEIDFDNGTISASTAVLLDNTGATVGTGNWQGVFAGPNGEEIAGILFVDSTGNTGVNDAREIGGFVATTP